MSEEGVMSVGAKNTIFDLFSALFFPHIFLLPAKRGCASGRVT